MRYERFEELPVWNHAIDLGNSIFTLCEDRSFWYQGDLAKQLGKSGLSISNNIAEGFERETTRDLLNFIRIAKGSAGEVRSMLHLIGRNERYLHLEDKRLVLLDDVQACSRQLQNWGNALRKRL